MYSMVLMMAMASGPDTAALGHHRGGSCCGAQASSCAPAPVACCAAPAPVSYSCHGGGSGCHGGGGILGHHNRGNSCHGGGGILGHHRGNSCHGGGGCYGSSVAYAAPCCAPAVAAPVTPTPPSTMPTPMGEKKGS